MGKEKAVSVLRDYFHKNFRALRSELILINRFINVSRSSNVALPDASHGIWRKILRQDDFIPSEHIAYKLLLSRLRSKLLQSDDPVIELEAARSVRSFIEQNQRTMHKELSILLQQGAAV